MRLSKKPNRRLKNTSQVAEPDAAYGASAARPSRKAEKHDPAAPSYRWENGELKPVDLKAIVRQANKEIRTGQLLTPEEFEARIKEKYKRRYGLDL
jgi:hypothetical protein